MSVFVVRKLMTIWFVVPVFYVIFPMALQRLSIPVWIMLLAAGMVFVFWSGVILWAAPMLGIEKKRCLVDLICLLAGLILLYSVTIVYYRGTGILNFFLYFSAMLSCIPLECTRQKRLRKTTN